VVLVTGASSGIGRATALRAAADGAHVVLAARGEKALTRTEDEVARAGAASTLVVPTDVGDDEAVRHLVAAVLGRHGRIDTVVNCAGVVAYGRVEDIPAEVFDGVLRTNLTGSVNIARHVLPVLRRQGAGNLVLVGSVIGHLGVPTMTPYAVSKWGVRALARQLQLENRDVPGVHIRYVAPGGVATPIYRQSANYVGTEGMPPPPVKSASAVAERILARVGTDRRSDQLALANDVMRLGFSLFPRVYDLLVGPLMAAASRDASRPVPPHPGNVLTPQEYDDPDSADGTGGLRGVLRNLAQAVGGLR
jgi:NAD(P)-dependent dehydrogenase (short-subunit alcohol dehydrogenase family)